MDFTTPVSGIMTRKLFTVIPGDSLAEVKKIFDEHRIHHIPVVKYTTLVGIISEVDFIHFTKGHVTRPHDESTENALLEKYKAEDIMTKGIATIASNERINVALQIFAENLFHALPIVDDGQLVGMVTTFDIIKALVEEDNARIKAM